MQKRLLIIFTFILIALVSDRLIFTSNSYKLDINPPVLNSHLNSSLEIEIYRINLLGFKVPFSKPEVLFTTENENLIAILQTASNKATVTSKGITGEAVVIIYSAETRLELKRIVIPILPPPSAQLWKN
ncbi:MAG: hypothetical protein N2510_06805 [Ignavibacteria bacterium]|nr:hypothetical protein [Ignavibacteria bacterium]